MVSVKKEISAEHRMIDRRVGCGLMATIGLERRVMAGHSNKDPQMLGAKMMTGDHARRKWRNVSPNGK